MSVFQLLQGSLTIAQKNKKRVLSTHLALTEKHKISVSSATTPSVDNASDEFASIVPKNVCNKLWLPESTQICRCNFIVKRFLFQTYHVNTGIVLVLLSQKIILKISRYFIFSKINCFLSVYVCKIVLKPQKITLYKIA